jgi:transglutaminase-like putative cysteine protease
MNFSFQTKTYFVLLICLAFSVTIFAGDDPPQWRPVSPAELAMKTPTVEPDADAEAIFWEVRLDDKKEGKLTYSNYVRVKIFTERGRERFAKFDLPFTKNIKIEGIAARVTKPDGSVINLLPTDIFEREIIKADKVKIKAKSFAVAGIEPGVIFEYQYREVRKNDSAGGERLVFQKDVPIQKISYYVRPREGFNLRQSSFNMPSDVTFDKAQGEENKDFSVATMTNVKAFNEEPYMPPADVVRSWTLLNYAGFYIFNGWRDVANGVSIGFKEDTKANDDIKKTAQMLTANATTAEDKVRNIYNFVQKEINNISYDTTISDEVRKKIENKKPSDTLKRRAGNVENIEKLFVSLAIAAGFETRIVWSGSRDEFFFNPNIHSSYAFVHPCCSAVKIDGKFRYLNPGTPYLGFGQLIWYEEDVAGILIGENGYDLNKTTLSDQDKNNAKRTGRFKLSENGTLEGTITIEYSGQRAITRRKEGYNDSEQKRLDDFKAEWRDQMSTAEFADVKVENFSDNSKPLVYSCKVRIPNYAQKTGKRLFLQPGFFEYGNKPIFSDSKRIHDIFFRYPWSENDDISIEIPTNYVLDNAETPGDNGDNANISKQTFKITIESGTVLKYKRSFYFGSGGRNLFPVSVYPALKGLFDKFQQSDSHTLTLKQKV